MARIDTAYCFSPRVYQPDCLPVDDEFDRQVTEDKAVVAKLKILKSSAAEGNDGIDDLLRDYLRE
jgi:hypothetical protein